MSERVPDTYDALRQISERQQQTIEVAPDATPVDFLQKVYRSPAVPLHSRLKAAVECAQYLHPKLAVTALIDGKDFASLLEQRIRKNADAIPKLAAPALSEEATPEPEPALPVSVQGAPMVPDRRFRRG